MPDASPTGGMNQFVKIEGLKRYFDVSAPWLVRALEGRPRQIVQAVDGIDIEIEGGDRAEAEALLKQAADKLLANTVIENYRVDVLG